MTIRFRTAARPHRPDLRLLPARDRALLRIVNRSKAGTSRQLAGLARAHPRKIQQRARLLWLAGYLERATLAPPASGRSPLAHRLSRLARRRLGYRDRRTAGVHELQHRLDILETVCGLARATADTPYPVQAWLSETAVRRELTLGPEPDGVVVLQLPSGSAVLCLEVDEGTQHAPVIGRKLRVYRDALADRPGWHLLFVAGSAARRSWILRRARSEAALGGWVQGWICELMDVADNGLAASAWSLGDPSVRTLADLATDRTLRRCPTPVGSPEWLELLAAGGGEDFAEALR